MNTKTEKKTFTLSNGKVVFATIDLGPMARSASNRYVAESSFELTEQDAHEIQIELGFHPAGYGLWGFKFANRIATWESSVHCD